MDTRGERYKSPSDKLRMLFIRYKMHLMLYWVLLYFIFVIRQSGQMIFIVTVVYNLTFIIITSSFAVFCVYYLLPKYGYNKKLFAFFSFFILSLIITSVLNSIASQTVFVNLAIHPVKSGYFWRVPGEMLFTFLVTLGFAGIKITEDFLRAKWEQERLQKENLKQELEFLKAQLHPHFLFNTLNNVYFLIQKNPALASEKLLKLSDLLRYQLYQSGAEQIFINKEIENIRNYAELEKIRKEKNISVSIDINSNVNNLTIFPNLLMPLVENAFKHLSEREQGENVITIKAEKLNGSFIFKVNNTKDNIHINGSKTGGINSNGASISGIGYKNLKRRLELLYPGKHSLSINDSGDEYEVTLTIETAEAQNEN